ncbi:TetR/AcrR family transcriptional regulator [Lichenihabitans psoromatis]|uniref:TetR/AcrR family transcriptional regulator n=1 Tax=Lichenihabitans psoromatis TaxID=2528642 RepID=UPI001FE21105|nr:TetR/AcrR family transcriptional regulator [Lichenihabitans psoromatis]
MNARPDDQNAGTSQKEGGKRRLRADAKRSVDAIVAAAKELFATTGVDATTREIADRAGIGMGTLFRRFPQRADLIAAVFHSEMDACAGAATTLAAEYPPAEALARWMLVYAEFIATKRGLAKALSSGDPVFVGLFVRFDQILRPAARILYKAAEAAGQVRPNLDATEILCAVTTLCMSTYDGKPDHAGQMVAIFVEGLQLQHCCGRPVYA